MLRLLGVRTSHFFTFTYVESVHENIVKMNLFEYVQSFQLINIISLYMALMRPWLPH